METIEDMALLSGLTGVEAARRLAQDGPNELPTEQKRNLLQQAWEVIRQPILLLLLGAGTVNFVLAEPLDGAVLMSFVVVVIAISIYQEHKTENALAALRDLSSPRTCPRTGRMRRAISSIWTRSPARAHGVNCHMPSRTSARSHPPPALDACRAYWMTFAPTRGQPCPSSSPPLS
jgi:hypothetical protein